MVAKLFLYIAMLMWAASFSPAAQAAPAGRADQAFPLGGPDHVRLLTGPSGGSWHALGVPIARALSQDVLPTSSRLGGGLSNVAAIGNGRGDLAFSLNCIMSAKDSGDSAFAGMNVDNSVILANIYPQVLYIVVSSSFADQHGIVDMDTLLRQNAPVRFGSLLPGTASEFILNVLLRHGYNTGYEQLIRQGWTIGFYSYTDAADSLADGRIDCFAFTAGVTVPLIADIEKHRSIQILPVSPAVTARLATQIKTTQFVIQPGAYTCVTAPVPTLGDYTAIIARKDLPDDLAYSIAASLWKNKDGIAVTISDFGLLAPATAMPEGLPVHAGAADFWKSLLKDGETHALESRDAE